jgi:hypothetical protein
MANERKMTVKGFLHKAGTKAAASAIAFLAAHRAWLETGELAEVTSPILRLLDEKQIMPTPALDEIKRVVLAHHLQVESEKAEAKLVEAADPSSHPTKPWVATIYDAKGNVVQVENTKGEVVDLEMSFAFCHEADRWTDRRLFEGAPDWFGVVQSRILMRADGTPISTTVMRDDAIARILKKPKSPLVKKTGVNDNRLSFGVKVQQTRSHFSHG